MSEPAFDLVPGEARAGDGSGDVVPAKRITCKQCGGSLFTIFFVEIAHAEGMAPHQHLECFGCGTSYCDGTCAVQGRS